MPLTIPRLPRGYRGPAVVAVHVALIPLAYATAFALRFEFSVPGVEFERLVRTLPYLLIIRVAVLARMKVFRGSWRHVGFPDLVTLSAAVTLSTLLFVMAVFLSRSVVGFPRSVLVLDWLLFIFAAGGTRFAIRWLGEGRLPSTGCPGKRALVIGAGAAAERFVRQSLHNGRRDVSIVGLLDDDPRTHGLSIHGVPVLGSIADLGSFASGDGAELVVIAIPSATGEQIRRIVALCAASGADFKILPSLQELLNGQAQAGQLRDVQVEDLLGRSPIQLDLEPVERDLAGKAVLVTGGAGSIGSELARQIAGFCPARLILFDQAESPLYFVHLELCKAYPALEVIPIVGDVTDADRLDSLFAELKPQYVFHAAAYKHVPMMESNVREAVRNNVLGTLRIVEASADHEVEKFVLISTDKAVNPSSVMGATKRLAERIVLSHQREGTKTDFRAVRFGNVLGSDGSVIPLFQKQLAAGGPLTVTHPDVNRYFMSIPEAVQLVLQASALPESASRISMLEMGEPVRIVDLAEQLVRLSGLTPYRDVQIVFTGLRPGEKLTEELMSRSEATVPTTVERIRIVDAKGVEETGALMPGLTRFLREVPRGDSEGIRRQLAALVPEYACQLADCEVAIVRDNDDAVAAHSSDELHTDNELGSVDQVRPLPGPRFGERLGATTRREQVIA